MTMRGALSLRWVAAVAAMIWAGACRCPPSSPDDCNDIVVSFVMPTDGATVAATVDAAIKVTNMAGDAVDIDSATIATRPVASGSDFGPARDGTVSANQATFNGITLDAGMSLLKAIVQKKNSQCTSSAIITVTVPPMNMGTPAIATFKFQGDADNNDVLNVNEVPLTTADIVANLTATGVNDQCTVAIQDQGDTTKVYGTGTFTSGAAAVTLSNLPNKTDASYNLQAVISCPDTMPPRMNNLAMNPEAKVTLKIDRIAPTCMIDVPAKMVLGPNDDVSLDPGFQLRTLATSSGATSMTLKLTGGATPQTFGPQAPDANGQIANDFTVPASGSVSYTVEVDVLDDAGNSCTAMRPVLVKFDAPVVTITSPTDGGSPYNTLMIPLKANVTGGEGGTVHFSSSLSGDLGTFTVTGGMVSGTGSFQPGSQTVTAVATDLANNVSAPDTQIIVVTQPAGTCTLQFTRPSSNPALITTNDLVGGMYNVQVQSSCMNTAITLSIDGANPTMATSSGTGLAQWTIALTDGAHVLKVDVGSGATANSASVNVTVDTMAPSIVQPFAANPPAVLNASQDLNRAVAGVQQILRFTATVPMGGRVDVCSDQTPPPTGATACADGAGGWWTLKTGAMSPEPAFTFPDGTYDIKVVVVAGTSFLASAPLALFVDSIRPVATAVAFPQDANNDKNLNIAELNGMPPKITFTLGAGDTAATISSVVVKAQVGGTVFTSGTAATITGNAVTVLLDQNVTATESNYDWYIVITDKAGNTNVLTGGTADDPLNTPAVLTGYRIDKLAPTCSISSPSKLLLGSPDDADPAAGFQLQARASTSADVPSIAFSLTGTSSSMMSGATSSSIASVNFTVTEGTYNVGATCTDASGNATPATAVSGVVVDLTPPTCAITAPTAGGYSSFNIATTVSVMGPDVAGRPVTVLSTGSASPVGTLNVSGMSATGMLTYPSGMQTITATVTDPAGNLCTTAGVAIDVNAVGCSISFKFPTAAASGKAYINKAADMGGTPGSATFTATGHSSNCHSGEVVKLINVTGAPATLGTGMVNASGDVSISNAVLAEGGPYTLRLEIDNGTGLLTDSDLMNVFVDLTPPVAGTVTPSGTNLKFVASTNPNVGSPGYIKDLVDGDQADFNVDAASITGAVGGVLKVLYGSPQVVVKSVNITTDPQTVTSLATQIPTGGSGQFTIEIDDEAGNALKPTDTTATVDVIPPDAPVVTQTLTDPRAATVSLQWMPTYNDGCTSVPMAPANCGSASGAVAGYDIRWTTSSVTLGDNLMTSADYFDSTKAFQEALVPASGTQLTKAVTVPPLNTYFIAVRAKDAIGNYSPYTAPTGLANLGTQVAFSNPTGLSDLFGNALIANGSVDGDAIDDIVVSARTSNVAYVYFGGTLAPQTTCTMPACQTIALPGTSTGDDFGREVAVGNIGGSASPDIAVGSRNYNGQQGRTFIFFGGARPVDTTNFVEIRGNVAGGQFGRPFVLPDIDGDGVGELAISAPLEGTSFRGRVYIFKGRNKAGFDALGTPFVPATMADWIIEGPTTPPATGNSFGQQRGFTSLGAFTSGGGVAFTVPASADTVNKLFIFSGATVAASSAASPLTTGDNGASATPPNQAMLTVTLPTAAHGNTPDGFGSKAFGNINFVGSSLKDLLVATPQDSKLYLFQDGTSTSWGSPAFTVTGTLLFGSALGVSDFNADSAPDMVSSQSAVNAEAWLLLNHISSFEPTVGAGFWMSKFYKSPSASALTPSVATGDFDGDGKPDIAIGDFGNAPGKVLVWH
jgi:hypothetical protein